MLFRKEGAALWRVAQRFYNLTILMIKSKKILLAFIVINGLCTHVVMAQKVIQPPFSQEEWSKPYKPFCIVGNLYYVGTADLACYLITTPDGHILINSGLASSTPMIRANVEALGFKFSDIKLLMATHAHYDHVGAMAEIKKLTHAKMLIGAEDRQVLADGGSSDYVMGGHGATFTPVKADRLLHDKDTVSLGGVRILVLHHPGHTPGSCSFLLNVKDQQRSYRVLIANMPTILDDTRLSGMPGYPNVAKDYGYTLNAMKELQFDIWLSSHASQFDLEKKHPQGAAYNPLDFADQAGYYAELESLQKRYEEKLAEKQR